jgi:hypothetical protein
MDIAKLHPEEASRPWILLHAKTKAEQDGILILDRFSGQRFS